MFLNSSNVNLCLYISPIADVIYNDLESHLASYTLVVRKVIHNFTNSFMKHPQGGLTFHGSDISIFYHEFL